MHSHLSLVEISEAETLLISLVYRSMQVATMKIDGIQLQQGI